MNVGLKEFTRHKANIYPNPTSDIIKIALDKYIENATLKVINVLGATVMQKENWNGEQMELDLSALENGVYILDIQHEEINYSTKVIKQ